MLHKSKPLIDLDIDDDEFAALFTLVEWIRRERAAGYPPRGLCDDATDEETDELIDRLARDLGSADRLRLAMRSVEKIQRAVDAVRKAIGAEEYSKLFPEVASEA